MIKSLITRKVCIPSFSWFRNVNGVQNNFAKNEQRNEKKEEKRRPNSYDPIDGCPHSWVERIGFVTTALLVGLNLKTHNTSSEAQRPKREPDGILPPTSHSCPLSDILSRYVLFAKPGAKLNILPEKRGSKLSNTKQDLPSTSRDKSSWSIDKTLEELEAGAIEYTNELNNVIAMAYLQNNEPQKAIKLLNSCSKSGKAMFNLGLIFELGKHDSFNRAPDYQQAVKCYEVASTLGHKHATYNLALIYLYGKGQIENNEKKANSLLMKAAELGVEEAKAYVEANLLKDVPKTKTSMNDNIIVDSNPKRNRSVNKSVKMVSSSSAPDLSSLFSNFTLKNDDKPRRKFIFAQDSGVNSQTKESLRCDASFGSNMSLEICFVN